MKETTYEIMKTRKDNRWVNYKRTSARKIRGVTSKTQPRAGGRCRILVSGAIWFACFGGTSLEADGQEILYTLQGDIPGSYAHSVSGVGDVNNDGFDDVIVDFDGSYAKVFSGADGSELYSLYDNAGVSSVSGSGDVNGDGVPDVIVGYGRADRFAGRAVVYSGDNGAVIYSFDGSADRYSDLYQYGWEVSGAGDVNADGYADVIIGALPGYRADVRSGADGAVLYRFANGWDGGSGGEIYRFVSGVGDVNADGYPDVILGGDSNAMVFSGEDGATLHTLSHENWQIYYDIGVFGASVSGAGDVDGDGFDDLIVGANYSGPYLFSGQTGALIADLDHGGARAVAGIGDLNRDGFDDVAVAATYDNGDLPWFAGPEGAPMTPIDTGFSRISSVSGAGDVNGDGVPDIVAGGSDGAVVIAGPNPVVSLENLTSFVASLNLQQGIDNSLDSKLDAALSAFNDANANNDGAACNSLQAFINAVNAQRGTKITDLQAEELERKALNIRSLLGCP